MNDATDRPYRDERPPLLTQSDLEQLRSTVAHCKTSDILEVLEGLEPEKLEALDKYFNDFAAPNKTKPGNPCLRCHEPLSGDLLEALFSNGGFEWGLTHGWGHCKWCGWPTCAYHFVKDKDGNDIGNIRNILLQVHPDGIETRKKEKAL